MPSPQGERKRLQYLVSALQEGLPEGLLNLSLYGEAASEAYRPGTSPLTTVLVLDDMRPERLALLRGILRRRRLRKLPIPLLMDPAYMETSLDVFPLEFLQIVDRHRTLLGDSGTFAGLEFDACNLRREVEQQLKGKLLHLRAAYLQVGTSRRSLLKLLTATPADFEIILRGMLYLADRERPERSDALLDNVEQAYSIQLPTLRRLQHARAGGRKLERAQAETLIHAYLIEARDLARLVDAL